MIKLGTWITAMRNAKNIQMYSDKSLPDVLSGFQKCRNLDKRIKLNI